MFLLHSQTNMKGIIIAFALFAVAASSSLSSEAQWQEFKVNHGKRYRSFEEESERKAVFMDHLKKINEHNEKFAKGLSTYTQGINFYSDWTYEEFANNILMEPQPAKFDKPINIEKPKTRAPASADWRDLMGTTRNQRSCGSCWAFAAVGVTEAAWAKAGNGVIDLSEQMVVDCDGNGSCKGGWTDLALETIIRQGGDCLETDYPYTAADGYCSFDANTVAAHISRYDERAVYAEGTEKLMQSIADNGPHAIYLFANENFQRYAGGIFDDATCPTNTINHAVIFAGYDSAQGYWIIRNSWGQWGEQGHMRIAMNKNVCNCEYMAWVPFV